MCFFPVVHKPLKEYELVFNVYNLENRLFLINGFYTSVALSSHGFSLYIYKLSSIAGSTLKCRNALSFDITALTHLYFFCSPLHVHFSTTKNLFLRFVF